MKINVSHVAKLANLPLSADEKKKFEKQLDETLEYIANLSEIDTKNIKPTSQVTGLENVVRPDEVSPSLPAKAAMQNTSSTYNNFIKVRAILEDN